MTISEIIAKQALTEEELKAVCGQSQKLSNMVESYAEQGLKFEVVSLSDDEDLSIV